MGRKSINSGIAEIIWNEVLKPAAWAEIGKLSETAGNPINGSVCLPSMCHSSPAQRDFSVTKAPASHGGARGWGEKEEVVNLLISV